MNPSTRLTLTDTTGALAEVAPRLGGWLLRYARPLPGFGVVDALHCDPAVVERYPREMYAGNPILFPLVSFNHLPGKDHHYVWEGREFEMPQHGFARRLPWAVVEQTPDGLTLELEDSDATRSSYPFAFRHRLTYRLEAGRLLWTQEITNRSAVPMPFATGFHPYFAVPLTSRSRREDCFVVIPDGRRLTMHGRGERFTSEPFPGQNWSVAEDVSATLFLADLKRRELILVDPGSGLEVCLGWEQAPQYRYVALWARSTTDPFYCLEPWTALSNAFTRAQERELVVLAPGEVFTAGFTLELRPT